MNLDVSDKFFLKLLTCIGASQINFGEHNDLTKKASGIISYEFPKDIKIDLEDTIFITNAFYNKRPHYAEIFLKSFARKDPNLFSKLAYDQSLPRKLRSFKISDDLRNKIMQIANIYHIKYEEVDLKELI